MKAEGDCPDCGSRLGVQIADGGIPIPNESIKRLMDIDGNAMFCQTCNAYHDPDDIEVIE